VARRVPEGPPPPPPVQRIRIRYAKRGRLRFSSHRDFARAFERAIRRSEIPIAFSAGFHPHPKISYVGAAPTGVGSEAEYLEIALSAAADPELIRQQIDAALPDGLDLIRAVDALDCPPGNFAEQMQASLWHLEIAGSGEQLTAAVASFMAAEQVTVQRLTKDGHRELDARAAVVSAVVRPVSALIESPAEPGPAADSAPGASSAAERAILELVVRQVTPSVRPDDVLAALHSVAGFAPSQPARATRLAQGPLEESAVVGDPFGELWQTPRDLRPSVITVSVS
jgi:radical SAM-linked protein